METTKKHVAMKSLVTWAAAAATLTLGATAVELFVVSLNPRPGIVRTGGPFWLWGSALVAVVMFLVFMAMTGRIKRQAPIHLRWSPSGSVKEKLALYATTSVLVLSAAGTMVLSSVFIAGGIAIGLFFVRSFLPVALVLASLGALSLCVLFSGGRGQKPPSHVHG